MDFTTGLPQIEPSFLSDSLEDQVEKKNKSKLRTFFERMIA